MPKDNLAGGHLILDVLVRDLTKINREQETKEYLDKVTDLIGLTQIVPAHVFKFPFSGEVKRLIEKLENDETCNNSDIIKQASQYKKDLEDNKCGVSGSVIFAESHAACHSWPEKKINDSQGGITIDVFSCNTLNAQQVIDFTAEHYSALQINGVYLERSFGEPPTITEYEWIYKDPIDTLFHPIYGEIPNKFEELESKLEN